MAVEIEIRNRLAELVKEHSQATVARAGGVPGSSVYRYLQGRRIPAEFCARACKSLGVSLSWLMYGSGKATETAGTAQSGELADKLGGLVATLLAVEKETEGLLPSDIAVGKFHRLQELLTKAEDTRVQVQLAIEPIALQLIDQLNTSVTKRNLIRCADLDKALRYLLQLSPRDEIREQIELASSSFAHIDGRYDQAVQLREGILWRYLSSGSRNPVRLAGLAAPLVSALFSIGESQESLALANAVLAGVRTYTNDHDCTLRLRAVRASSLAETGNLKDAVAELYDILPRLKKDLVLIHYGKFQKLQVLSGLLSLEDAFLVAPDLWSWSRAIELTRLAIWTEDPTLLKQSIDRIAAYDGGKLPDGPVMPRFARCLLDLLSGKTDESISTWQDACKSIPKTNKWYFIHRLREAKLIRIDGDEKQARNILKGIIKGIHDGSLMSPRTILNTADMLREASRLGLKVNLNGVADEEWLAEHVENGFRMFQER